jgi:hypothetical protein
MAQQLAVGLADNWSQVPMMDVLVLFTLNSLCIVQVRMAACVASRAFLQSMCEATREEHLPLLLPRLCINR